MILNTVNNHTTTTTTLINKNSTIPLQTNSSSSNNDFLKKLTETFHVTNRPALAIFLLVLICILCLTLIILIILCIRTFVRRRYVPKVYRKKEKPVYVDDIPGLRRFSNATNTNHHCGTMEYSLNYHIEEEQLEICVIQANNLASPTEQEKFSAYTEVSLVKYENDPMTTTTTTNDNHPNDTTHEQWKSSIEKQFRTDIIHQSNKPCWNQSFVYKLTKNQLNSIVIYFEVFQYNDQYVDISLGQLKIPLNQIDHSEYAGRVLEKTDWLSTSMSHLRNSNLGELCIGLGYYPDTSRIDLCVFEARNLNLDQYFNDLIINEDDSKWKFLKTSQTELNIEIYLKYHDRRLLKKCKTQTRKELINPYFNETFSFKIKEKHIKNAYVKCQLMQVEKWRFKRILGEVSIGLEAVQLKGTKHWDEMLKTPGKLHVRWHSILPVMISKRIPFISELLCIDYFQSDN
ncbi:unnamed protein product [Schistosoma turkestanicum]|nr:unnamed protein product [Schistosoma turkestanicum]